MSIAFVDIVGAGFVPGVPGLYSNCRVYYADGVVVHVGPLYQEWNEDAPTEPVVEPVAPEPLVFGTGG